ncbi:MAG: DUF378 domain-containing protein [Armatimonadetes bacterium]|nr:DUF378 domain-containing protein [Armatimonadota bacterium]
MAAPQMIAMILVIVGALNWLLVGLFKFDLVAAIFGEKSALSRIVYTLVGIAGIYAIWILVWMNKLAAGS